MPEQTAKVSKIERHEAFLADLQKLLEKHDCSICAFGEYGPEVDVHVFYGGTGFAHPDGINQFKTPRYRQTCAAGV